MKVFSLVFSVIFAMLLLMPGKLNQAAMVKAENTKNEYHEAISSACQDAAKALMIFNDSYSTELGAQGKKENFQKIALNLKEGLDRFYRSMYIDLDIENSYSQQQALMSQFPVIIAIGYDGYFVHTWNETKENGKYTVTNKWTDKKKYSIFDSKFDIKISYTLDDYVYIEDYKNNKKLEGDRKNFASLYPSYFSDSSFKKVKQQVINQLLQKDLEYYTYYCNRIAKQNGWKLKFKVPYWGNRSIDTISFLAFYQGKIFQAQDRYDSYGYGAAKIVEHKQLYGYEKNGHKYYSRHKNGTNLTAYYDEYEAAENGCSPDPEYYK
ncbi:hypothetical protein [Clostridium oryzae]|uniref:Uncharacterized protein n=1 Tax=Clostridium oryzae TaxID=1450648 RepID=A0A1V4IMF2_9CLOT|nr:hypothetical protein [Clostridium oryzae]OPJ60667.1 hypothetical protein CLORY_27180 [Clostridium oryzae]